MINTNMRIYNFFTLGTDDGYGQSVLPDQPSGTIKISIDITSQSIQDNINYKNCQYIGLTQDTAIDDTYIIDYEGKKLKVLYVNPRGKLKQVFLSET